MRVEGEEEVEEDLAEEDLPELEEGETDKIIDPLAEEEQTGGRRKRAHAKVDYVALEAQLRKEEKEMRDKMRKTREESSV